MDADEPAVTVEEMTTEDQVQIIFNQSVELDHLRGEIAQLKAAHLRAVHAAESADAAAGRRTAEKRHVPLLTEEEHAALALTAELANTLGRINGGGRSRSLEELFAHVHDIQHAILAQAAARAYPGKYRLLGESFDD